MSPKWQVLLLLAALTYGSLIVAMVVQLLIARLVRVRVLQLRIGLGPKLLEGHLGTTPVTLALPLPGYSIRTPRRTDFHEDIEGERCWEDTPWIARVFSSVAPLLLLAATALLALGADAPAAIYRGFPQLLAGAFSPFGAAQELLGRLPTRLERAGAWPTLGTMAAKMLDFHAISWLIMLPGQLGRETGGVVIVLETAMTLAFCTWYVAIAWWAL